MKTFTLVAILVSMSLTTPVFAGGNHGHDNDKSNQKYEVGFTDLWFKDDSRSFDPRLDWNCSSTNMNNILDAFGIQTCDFTGDGVSDLVTGPRGKRTIPLKVFYPVEKEHAKHSVPASIADITFGSSVSDCVAYVRQGYIPFISFGFGFEYTFTSGTPDGTLNSLFLPDTLVTNDMLTTYCKSNTLGALKDAKPAQGKFPVITFSHGNGDGGQVLEDDLNLVKAGYILLVPVHVGDAAAYLPSPQVLGNRVPSAIATRISSTGFYPTQELPSSVTGGAPDIQAEQDIKMRVEDILAVINFATNLNETGKPNTLLQARNLKTLKSLKGSLAMDQLGFSGISNGGSTGYAMLKKPQLAKLYKAALIKEASVSSTPLQYKVDGTYLQSLFGRTDVLRPNGYVYNSNANSDQMTYTVPMLTYIGVEDDIFPLIEWCSAGGFCTVSPTPPGSNSRIQNTPTRSNLHPLTVNGVIAGASGPQYLLNINNMDHIVVPYLDLLNQIPSINAVLPNVLFKESIWDTAGNFLFLGTDPANHGYTARYQLLDSNTMHGVTNLFTLTWMDLYLKNKLCSNTKDVKILDNSGNVLVTVPKSWNNLKILKSAAAFAPASVDSVAYNNLLVGLKIPKHSGAPENIPCKGN